MTFRELIVTFFSVSVMTTKQTQGETKKSSHGDLSLGKRIRLRKILVKMQ